jgi:hypothetical protein
VCTRCIFYGNDLELWIELTVLNEQKLRNVTTCSVKLMVMYYICCNFYYMLLNSQSLLVTICTGRFNVIRSAFSTHTSTPHFMYVSHVSLTINIAYFPIQHPLIGLSSRRTLCLLWPTTWIVSLYMIENSFILQRVPLLRRLSTGLSLRRPRF